MKEYLRRHPRLKDLAKWGRDALRGSYHMPALLIAHSSERRYIIDWMTVAGRHPLRTGKPLLSFRAIKWLEQVVTPQSSVFEWGSGGSTIFLARRARYTVSVEHSPFWHEEVSRRLSHLPEDRYRYVAIEPEELEAGEPRDAAEPSDYVSEFEPGLGFEGYVRIIDRYPNNHFDLVLVDGRSRPSCVAHALPKIKPGAVLVLDDAHRPRYQKVIQRMDGWEPIDISGIRSDVRGRFVTTIAWRKPL